MSVGAINNNQCTLYNNAVTLISPFKTYTIFIKPIIFTRISNREYIKQFSTNIGEIYNFFFFRRRSTYKNSILFIGLTEHDECEQQKLGQFDGTPAFASRRRRVHDRRRPAPGAGGC